MPRLTGELKETGVNGIENKTKRKAVKLGFWVRKFNSMSNPGVPDDIFLTPSGVTAYVEFKSPGKKPTYKQEKNLSAILDRGGNAFVVDDLHQKGVSLWKKDFGQDIQIWHDGYKLLQYLLLL